MMHEKAHRHLPIFQTFTRAHLDPPFAQVEEGVEEIWCDDVFEMVWSGEFERDDIKTGASLKNRKKR